MSEDSWIKLEAATRNIVVLLRLKKVDGLSCAGVPSEPTARSLEEEPGEASNEVQAEITAAVPPSPCEPASVGAAAHSPGMFGETELLSESILARISTMLVQCSHKKIPALKSNHAGRGHFEHWTRSLIVRPSRI